ncbi:MAG: hypothetical protein EBV64_02625 [Oxalobacteraceae bacterium]|nr:hypothetical protein [Oxalobacteraceae bacterium]
MTQIEQGVTPLQRCIHDSESFLGGGREIPASGIIEASQYGGDFPCFSGGAVTFVSAVLRIAILFKGPFLASNCWFHDEVSRIDGRSAP